MAYHIGAGTTLSFENGASFEEIPQVKTITPPQMTLHETDVTHLSSAAKEFKGTIHEGGEVSFELLYDPGDATHATLNTSFRAKSRETWKITLSDATEIFFDGFITQFGVGPLSTEDPVMIPGKIRVTGMPA